MKTAVEYLFEKLWNTDKDKFTWYAILKQAKEMEKEQIKDAHYDGKGNGINISHSLSRTKEISADEYYDETFKSE